MSETVGVVAADDVAASALNSVMLALYRRARIRWIEEPFSGAAARFVGSMEQLPRRANEHRQLGLVDVDRSPVAPKSES